MIPQVSTHATVETALPRSENLCLSQSYSRPCNELCCKQTHRATTAISPPPVSEEASSEILAVRADAADLLEQANDPGAQPEQSTSGEQISTLSEAAANSDGEETEYTLLFAMFCFPGVNFGTFVGLQLSPFLALVDTGAQHAVVGSVAWKNLKQLLSFRRRNLPTAPRPVF